MIILPLCMRRWAITSTRGTLGGASKSSGIPLGSELVDRWLASCMPPRVRRQGEVQGSQGLGYPGESRKDRFHLFKWDERASF